MTDEFKTREQLISELARLRQRLADEAGDAPAPDGRGDPLDPAVDPNGHDLLKAVNRSPAVTIIWRASDGWPVVFASESVRRYGHVPQDLIGLVQHERYIASEDLPVFLSTFAEAGGTRDRRSFTREYRFLSRTGEPRWVSERMWVERDDAGRATHYCGLLSDIHALRCLEATVREQQQRLSALFEHATHPILLHDLTGRCLDANEAACDLLGFGREELLQVPLDALYTPEAAARAHRLAQGLLDARHAVMESEFIARDGGRVPIVLECRVVELASGRAILTSAEAPPLRYAALPAPVILTRPEPPEPPEPDGEVAALQSRLSELEAAKWALQVERDALAAARSTLQAERDALAESQSALLAERDALAATHASLQAERDGLEAAHASLRTECDGLAADRAECEERLRAHEVLLRDVHHRVKNNLQVVASLLGLQAEYISDPKALEAFSESQNRVRAMALVHERVYQSSDLARLDLATYVRDLAEQLLVALGANDTVELRVEADAISLAMDTAIPCGLLLGELISNSVKHAFPERRDGVVSVSLRSDGERVVMSVADNGVGLPADVDFRNTPSLGLQLVMILVQQLGATIELDTMAGTRFTIAFRDGV